MDGRRRIVISSQFIKSVIASLFYWLEATREMDEKAIVVLDRERQNLFRAVRHGLALGQAWEITAELSLAVIPLVNRRLYYREWIPVLAQLVSGSPADHERTKFDLLTQLGRLQRLEQDRDTAMDTLQEAVTLAQKLEDEQALARAYYHIGRLYLDARNYPEAEEKSQNALDILAGLEVVDQTLMAWVLNTLGKVTQIKGDFNLADEYYSRSSSIWRHLGDQTGLARALIDLGINFRWFSKPDRAITHYKEAEGLLSSTNNELDKTTLGINLGATYFDIKEYSLAEDTLRNAYSPYLRKSGDLIHQAILTMNLANVLLASGRLAEAEAYAHQAIALWGKLDDDLNRANSIGILGEILAGKGQAEEAIPLFDQAITLFKKYPSHPRAIRSINNFQAEKQKVEDRLNR